MNSDTFMEKQHLKSLSLLYVEDNADTRIQFIAFLNRTVGRVITAVDGAEGLEAFRTHAPDIVLTDILMPNMDGLTMAGEIRILSPSVPIIAITAFDEVDYLLRAVSIGIEKFIFKPVTGQILLDCLCECVRRMKTAEKLTEEDRDEEWSEYCEINSMMTSEAVQRYDQVTQDLQACATLAEFSCDTGDYLKELEKCYKEAYELGEVFRILGIDFSEKMQSGSLLPVISHSIEKAVSGSSVRFTVDSPDELPEAGFIEHLIQLVFTCISVNALEAMPAGGDLTLSLKAVEVSGKELPPLKPGNYILCSLTDTGAGIPAEHLPKIFNPYFTTKKSGDRSAGLTLALCRIIMVNMGGKISAESTPGKGTVIRVWLPTAPRKL